MQLNLLNTHVTRARVLADIPETRDWKKDTYLADIEE